MNLVHIPAKFVDYAWRDGALKLGDSCVDECTPDQLKMLLSTGERLLVRIEDKEKIVGWSAYRIDQMPNMRVFYITNLYAPDAHFERFYDMVKEIAKLQGCSKVRCSAEPVQARLYSIKLGFKPVYQVLEGEV
jgi:hypothetical protein